MSILTHTTELQLNVQNSANRNAFPAPPPMNPPDVCSLLNTKDGQQRMRSGGGGASARDSSNLEKFAHCTSLPGLCFIYVGHQTLWSYFSTDADITHCVVVYYLI